MNYTTQTLQHVIAGWLVFCFSAQVIATSESDSVRLYDDPRVVAWSRDYLAGEEDAVLNSVEMDLCSDSPHPFAAQVWTEIHSRRERLEQVWNQLQDSQLRARLGVLPEIELLRDQHRHRELLKRYPAEEAGEITDVWALIELAISARELSRRMDEFAYLLAAAKRYPMHFQVAWMYEDVLKSDALRDRAASAIQPGGALAGTTVGAYLASFLAIRPWHDLDRLAEIDRWLSAYPLDARAIKARGIVLERQRYDREAADVHRQSLESYPFYSTSYSTAKALLFLDKEAKARALVRREASWRGPTTEVDEAWVEKRLSRALRESGNKGRARKVLDAARQRWPEDAGLLGERAALEIDDNRNEQAVTYARLAWKQARDDPDNQIRLLKALQLAGELNEAHELFEKFDKAARFRSRNFYARGSQILGASESHESRIALMQRALEDFPASIWMHGEYAIVLKEAGRPQEAWSTLRRALDLNPEYSWGSKQLVNYFIAEDDKAATAEMEDWIRRQPWHEVYWKQQSKLLTATKDQVALWQEAMRHNPGRLWPVEELVGLLVAEERWQEAQQAVESLFDTASASIYDRTGRHSIRAFIVVERATRERIESALVEHALADMEAFKTGYGWVENLSLQPTDSLAVGQPQSRGCTGSIGTCPALS